MKVLSERVVKRGGAANERKRLKFPGSIEQLDFYSTRQNESPPPFRPKPKKIRGTVTRDGRRMLKVKKK
jgi:hypothetical protein